MSNIISLPRRSMPDLPPRWKAELTYRSKLGPLTETHLFDELEDLDTIVETGPHWGALIRIEVVLNRITPGEDNLTVEEAADL